MPRVTKSQRMIVKNLHFNTDAKTAEFKKLKFDDLLPIAKYSQMVANLQIIKLCLSIL